MKKKLAVVLCASLATMSLAACQGKEVTSTKVDTTVTNEDKTEVQTEQTEIETVTVETEEATETETIDESFGGNDSDSDTAYSVANYGPAPDGVTSADVFNYLDEDGLLSDETSRTILSPDYSYDYTGLFAYPEVTENEYVVNPEISYRSNESEYVSFDGLHNSYCEFGFRVGMSDYAYYSNYDVETDDTSFSKPALYCTVDIAGEQVDVYEQHSADPNDGITEYYFYVGGFSGTLSTVYEFEDEFTEDEVIGMLNSISLVE